jgi:hypothetical protein
VRDARALGKPTSIRELGSGMDGSIHPSLVTMNRDQRKEIASDYTGARHLFSNEMLFHLEETDIHPLIADYV